MLYKPKSIEEYILFVLQNGTLGTIELLEEVRKLRSKTTKQAYYQALRKLKKEEAVVIYGKRVSLSHIWINNMSEFFTGAQEKYDTSRKPSDDFLNLADGDKISYTFKNPALTDMFWGHAFGILAERIKVEGESVCIYNPHEWFMLARRESEFSLFSDLVRKKKNLFALIGHKDALDRYTKKEFDAIGGEYYMSEKPLFPKNNYYINMFGDFLIEVWLDQETTESINKFYIDTTEWNEEAGIRLTEIIKTRGTNKLVISRNSRKAEKIKRIFRKYFVIKKTKFQDTRKESTNTLL